MYNPLDPIVKSLVGLCFQRESMSTKQDPFHSIYPMHGPCLLYPVAAPCGSKMRLGVILLVPITPFSSFYGHHFTPPLGARCLPIAINQ